MSLSLFAATACNKGTELSSGVSLDNLDTTVNPAEDFYHYACGGWLKAHPLDAEHSRYGAFDVLAETNQEQLRTLIDSLVSNTNEPRSLDWSHYSEFAEGPVSATNVLTGETFTLQDGVEIAPRSALVAEFSRKPTSPKE